MANNELAIRFTDGKYATRAEVSRELRMSLIDNIWSNILSYRSGFYHYLTIKSIEKNQLVICFCPSVSSLTNAVDMKLIRTMREYSLINAHDGSLNEFENQCLEKCLYYVAKKEGLNVDKNYIAEIVKQDNSNLDQTLLTRYLNALRFIKRSYASPIDIDFLAGIYSEITGINEITSFYRNTDDRNPENRVLIDRVYTCAPVILIESMMNSLFSFIQNASLSAVSKAAITYYYINYIRPFNHYSEEIAMLMAKAILAHADLADVGALLPLETILTENETEVARLFLEVQKSCDTTYFANFMMKAIEGKCEDLLDIIVESKNKAIRRDFYRQEVTISKPTEEKKEIIEQQTLDLFSNEEPQQVEKEELKPVVEQPKPVVMEEEPAVVEEKKETVVEQPVPVKKEQPKPTETVEISADKQENSAQIQQVAAYSYIPPVLDDKQIQRLEQHLLESDPSIRKHEAKFYARHCTIGANYTIAQYKKAARCVYETARTAMDHLTELGYYKKSQVKNKYVYTPVDKR